MGLHASPTELSGPTALVRRRVLGLDIPQRRRFGGRFRSAPGQVLLGGLRLCFVQPRRNRTSSVRSQLRVGDGARDLAAGVLQRAFAKGQLTRHELDERLSLILAARVRKTSDRPWRTWRNTSSFARTRRCGATGWTDGIVPIQSLKHQTPGVVRANGLWPYWRARLPQNSRDVVAFHWRQPRPTDPHAAGAGPFDPACDMSFWLWPIDLRGCATGTDLRPIAP